MTDNAHEYSVSSLSAAIKGVIEDTFGRVRVRGELSRVMVARSGHLYTTLKDENAVIDAVCWKTSLQRMKIQPAEGMEVICTGRLTTYAGKSSYQLVIEHMELAGIGALLKLIEERKQKLAAEGLFEESRKKPLPYLPRRICVITSPSGAVIRDILHRLSDRFPVPVWLWPVTVQGDTAAAEVTNAVLRLNALRAEKRPDLIIIARGGGSVEDLMPFNDEALVRAVAGSIIPIISAVGHETDTTLCDYAADVRAPTPTAAAEMAVPVRENVLGFVDDCGARMRTALTTHITRMGDKVRLLSRTLDTPRRLLEVPMQRLDRAGLTLDQAVKTRVMNAATRLARVHKVPAPTDMLRRAGDALDRQNDRMEGARKMLFERANARLDMASRMVETLSYRATLSRGYAVVRGADGQLKTRAAHIHAGEQLAVVFTDGETQVSAVQP